MVQSGMEEREQRYQEAMNLGHSAAWDQKWDLAAEYYKKAVKLGPRQVQAINNLGLAYFQLHQYKEAEVCYKQAAKFNPDDPLAVERLAQIYERTGKIKMAADYSMFAADLYLKIKDATKAIENWTRITQLIPEHLKAHSRLAVVHERLGHTAQAVREYISVAALLQDVGQVNEAVLAVEKAVKIAPKNNEARQALELVRSNKTLPKPTRQRGVTDPLRTDAVQEPEEPPELENTSISRQGPDPITEARQRALTELAGLLFDVSTEDLGNGDSKGAGFKSVFGRTKADDLESISKFLGAAIDYQTRANHDAAARELKKAVDLGLDVPATYFDLGLLYSQQNRPDRAIRYLQQAINHPQFALASHLLIAQQYLISNRLVDAAGEYLMALREADTAVVPDDQRDSLRAQYETLLETVILKNDASMMAHLCENIDDLLARRDWRDHITKARRQLPPGVTDGAPAPLAEIIAEAKDTQIVEAIASINDLARRGHLRSAMEESYLLVSQAPTYLPLHIHMAELLLQMDNTKGAIDKMIVVSEAYAIRGEAKRSINLLKRVVEIAPMDFNARSRLIQRLSAVGDVDNAIHEYIKLADVQYRLAQLDQARATYEKALRMAQQNKADLSWSVRILKQMADIDIQRLDWRQALRVYEQLRTLSPDDELTRTRLIELNVRLGQRNQAAVELDNFVSYLTSNARQEKALAYLENLVAENEEMAFARSKLAETYQKAGRIQEAVDQWDKVAELMVVQGNTERAKEVIRAILVLNPPNADQYRAALQQLG